MSASQKSERSKTEFDSIKGLAAPARRALAGAGYAYLEQLENVSQMELAKLHGMGPNALRIIKEALKGRNLDFKSE